MTTNFTAAFTLLLAVTATPLAQAHAKIESSQPKANSELASAPTEIRLQFNEVLEPAFSKIELVGANESRVALPKIAVDKVNPKVMFAAVPALKAGQYQVRWSAMTNDGHKVKGQFSFRTK